MAETPQLTAPSAGTAFSSDTSPARVPELRPVKGSRRFGEILVRVAVLAIAAVIAALFATRWDRWVRAATRQVTDNAYVRGDVTPLSAQVEGYVRHVAIDDFQRVNKGDLLLAIEDDDYKCARCPGRGRRPRGRGGNRRYQGTQGVTTRPDCRSASRYCSDPGRCRAHPAGGGTSALSAGHHLRHPAEA